jgi:hypothetical protein
LIRVLLPFFVLISGDSHFGYPFFYSPAPLFELTSLEEGRRKEREHIHRPEKTPEF